MSRIVPIPPAPAEPHYPDTDPEPMAETPIHMLVLVALIAVLREHFRAFADVYVIGNVYWYYERGNVNARRAPDLMVIRGVDPAGERRSYKEWQHGGGRPCFLLEVLSEETYKEDMGEKRLLYERLGVREYFLFDPEGLGLERPLVGYRLRNGSYETIPPAKDGSALSKELGLRVRPEGDRLAFASLRTGERLPDPPELAARLAEVGRELEEAIRVTREERLAREQAQGRADKERRAREQAEVRVDEERRAKEEAVRRADEERRARQKAARLAGRERRAKEEALRRIDAERLAKEEVMKEVERLRALIAPPADEPKS